MSGDYANPGGDGLALPVGARLGEIEIRRVLYATAWGLVYSAYDHDLARELAVEEYTHGSLARRDAALRLSAPAPSAVESFTSGLERFVRRARLLSRLDHPALVRVLGVHEANDTAYRLTPVLPGRSLQSLRRARDEPPDESWSSRLLVTLLDAMETLHRHGVRLVNFSTDNILINRQGHAVLLDFGARPGENSQRASSDLYSLGAVLHFVLLGRPPAPAASPERSDPATDLSRTALPGYSSDFLAMIERMLAPRPGSDPQSVTALRAALAGSRSAPRAHAPSVEPTGAATSPAPVTVRTKPPEINLFPRIRPRVKALRSSATERFIGAATDLFGGALQALSDRFSGGPKPAPQVEPGSAPQTQADAPLLFGVTVPRWP